MNNFIFLAILLTAGQFLLAAAVTTSVPTLQLNGSTPHETSIGASAASIRDGYDLPYPISVATFVGEVNGEQYSIQGSAARALAELKKKHPDVDFEARTAGLANRTSGAEVLTKRNTIYPPLCIPVKGKPWRRTWPDMAYPCVDSMKEIGGMIRIAPRTCALICCNRDARSFWCNDRYDILGVDAGYLGFYIGQICDQCMYHWWFFPRGACGGQLLDSDNWNVILRHTFDEPGSPEVC